jgi:hypothetical protein
MEIELKDNAALLVASLALMTMRDTIAGIHSRMLGVSKDDMGLAYVQYISSYKIAVIVLNIVPYFALRLMS